MGELRKVFKRFKQARRRVKALVLGLSAAALVASLVSLKNDKSIDSKAGNDLPKAQVVQEFKGLVKADETALTSKEKKRKSKLKKEISKDLAKSLDEKIKSLRDVIEPIRDIAKAHVIKTTYFEDPLDVSDGDFRSSNRDSGFPMKAWSDLVVKGELILGDLKKMLIEFEESSPDSESEIKEDIAKLINSYRFLVTYSWMEYVCSLSQDELINFDKNPHGVVWFDEFFRSDRNEDGKSFLDQTVMRTGSLGPVVCSLMVLIIYLIDWIDNDVWFQKQVMI